MGFLTDETAEKLERMFDFVTGSHFINYHYGAFISKCMKVLPVRDFDAQEIVPGLYLGDVYAAHNTRELMKRGITHIVTCTVGVAPPFPQHFEYMHLKILDCAGENINEHFLQTSEFISNAIKEGGTVLVHCMRGVSRSATIVCAHLMTTLHISPKEAVAMVRKKRPQARPNYGFMIQLEMYSTMMKNKAKKITVSEFREPPEEEEKDGAGPTKEK